MKKETYDKLLRILSLSGQTSFMIGELDNDIFMLHLGKSVSSETYQQLYNHFNIKTISSMNNEIVIHGVMER